KRYTDPETKLRIKHTNRRVRIPKGLYPRRIEEKLTKKQVGGERIIEREMTMISKDGTISKFPGYHSSEEEESTGQSRALNKYGFDEDGPLEHEASDKEVDSDLESTASSKSVMKKTTKAEPDRASRNCLYCSKNSEIGGNSKNNGCTYKGFMACNPKEYDGKGGAIALTRWIEKMENVIDNSVCAENQKVKYAASSFVNKALTWWNTQVQARGREAAIGMSWADFKALLVEEFCPSNEMKKLEFEFWNHKIVVANHDGYTDRIHELAKLVPHLVTPELSRIKRIRTNEAVSCATLIKGNEKRKGVEESSKNENDRSLPKCAKCSTYHPKDRPCLVCFNCQKPGHIARNCRSSIKQVASINAIRGGYKPRTCYECGSHEHYRNTYPKLNLAHGQLGNRLTIEGNQNSRNNRNQVKGRAFNVNAVGALQDPNIVMGTFSLNHHYATVLFDSGAYFSFISTSFAPLLNVKSCFVNPGYLIEVANGKKVEVDRVIRNCNLELGTSLFIIDLIPLCHGSFDVIVGMDWLSEHKA
nr:reverse transcriptase domain-containing protein [Tanacetum cinerariifolium]